MAAASATDMWRERGSPSVPCSKQSAYLAPAAGRDQRLLSPFFDSISGSYSSFLRSYFPMVESTFTSAGQIRNPRGRVGVALRVKWSATLSLRERGLYVYRS